MTKVLKDYLPDAVVREMLATPVGELLPDLKDSVEAEQAGGAIWWDGFFAAVARAAVGQIGTFRDENGMLVALHEGRLQERIEFHLDAIELLRCTRDM